MEPRPARNSDVTMTEIVLPQHANSMNTVFGGVLTSWVDMAAAISAYRHTNKPVVTASMDAVHFVAPVKVGWVVTIKARVNQVWNSSCEIGVKIDAENPVSDERFHTASAYVTMVALDSHKNPIKIPPVVHDDEDGKRRQEAAELRRRSRLELKKQLAARAKKES